MPVFEYKALNKKGKKMGGIVTADTPSSARLKLSQDHLFPMEIRVVKEAVKKSSAETFLSRFPGFRESIPLRFQLP